MIKGMTGFGQAQLSSNKVKALVEIKSVNHRYLDVNYYLPIGFGSIENKIRQIIQKDITRGRITVSVKIIEKEVQTVVLNKEVAKRYLSHAKVLKKEFGLKGELSLPELVRMQGVLEASETFVKAETLWPALEKCLNKAIKSLVVMREREGKSLVADVSDKLKRMLLQISKIQKKVKVILEEKKKSLTVEEFKSFQKSSDVNEEIARLSHYIEEMKMLLKEKISVGKKMDFIAQEMQRETNTIGSKVQDSVVSNAVIALKSKIEKIREQAQNIE